MADLVLVPESVLAEKVLAALKAGGADDASAKAATRAMLHASRFGIDSHGVRLTSHYAAMMQSGRINPRPNMALKKTAAGTARLDADNALGHAAAYRGMEAACELAREAGIGAVGVYRSSHFGAAGAYALAGAQAGFLALSTTNADSLVALHDGKGAFHGTNPIAVGAPTAGGKPWFMDLATSSIPFNRVGLARALRIQVPNGVALDKDGVITTDADRAAMLLPLGGSEYGFKGAALAGLVAILSAMLTGGAIDHEMMAMFHNPDTSTPRNLGHFCLAIDPDKFVGREAFNTALTGYLHALRNSPAKDGKRVIAPGDREWETAAARAKDGIPVDRVTAEFLGVS
jgi:ureidoglycolate dehydrogenase (NAD+)